jgi:DNA polymerase-3 subunit beta
MELTIGKRDFLRGLNRTYAVADRKSSMAVLANVHLSTEDSSTLRLAATDLYLGVTATAPAHVVTGGAVAVGAKTLHDIVRNLPEAEVRLSVGANQQVELECGAVRYNLPGMPGDDFPPLPNPGATAFVAYPAETLAALVAKTQYAMSTDDNRPHLAGTLFEGEGRTLRMVATDGHRLAKAEHVLDDGEALDFSMLVPAKGIGELKRLVEDAKAHKGDEPPVIEVAHAAGSVYFRRPNVLLSVKLADEQFPPYSRVIPREQHRRVVVARTALLEALRRVALVANEKAGLVHLVIEPGLLRLSGKSSELGEATEELEVDYAGDPLTIRFNSRYLVDCLTGLTDDDVALELAGDLDPGVVKAATDPNAFVGVVMPMRP